jgi:hypothetical protein
MMKVTLLAVVRISGLAGWQPKIALKPTATGQAPALFALGLTTKNR